MLGLLGPPVLVGRDRVEPLRLRPKAIALVAYLALADREVERQEVARLLFPEAEGPLAALRWHLAHVRSAGPPLVARGLRATRSTLSLRVPTDVAWFRRGADVVVRRPGVAGAAGVLALYRGDLVAGLSVSTTAEFDNWLYVEQEGLRRRFRQAAVAFARWALASRRAHGAVASLARLVTVDPYYEEGHVLLIETYEALGEAGHAASAYDRYQRIVRRELAAEPQPAVARRFETTVARRPTLPREDLIPLREVTLHVVDWSGAGPTILALHGSAGMAHSFGALAERLTPGHRFVGADLRGHGFSDKPPSGYDLERHVDDISELVAALHLRRPVLLGHSAGGAIATFLATRIDVAGLILLEAMIGDRAFAENAAAQAAPLAGSLGQPVAAFDTYLATWRARWGPLTDEAERLAERWARFALAPLPDGRYRERAIRTAVEAEWASIIAADGLAALARVTCPILIVQALRPWIGGRPYFTEAIVEAQRRAARAAEVFVAREADHATLVRDPDPGLIATITRFVDACGRKLSVRRPRR
ncbi:MAG: alpha/beta fold hydrolase [Candidatus Rokuibacteriota bacterium]|jgi:pimeloyl-ACP methyl ester carboxylesterase/DNA-binding SARP family transcriptional activator